MTAENQDFEIFAGDTRDLEMIIYDENDLIQDLTDCTVDWVLYNDNTDEILITKSTTDGIVITNAVGGVITVSLDAEDTEDIKPANWYGHEAEVTDPFSNVYTVLIGYVEIKRSRV